MFNMMKNSAPNRFIEDYIFQKAPTFEGGTSPLIHPLRRASATAGANAPVLITTFDFNNLPPTFILPYIQVAS